MLHEGMEPSKDHVCQNSLKYQLLSNFTSTVPVLSMALTIHMISNIKFHTSCTHDDFSSMQIYTVMQYFGHWIVDIYNPHSMQYPFPWMQNVMVIDHFDLKWHAMLLR